jgi:putative FmdB family regulatory protein
MPIYTYQCSECGSIEERVTTFANRDAAICDECSQPLQRSGVELFTLGQPAYQMKAILNNGEKVPGHFGKDAARKKS